MRLYKRIFFTDFKNNLLRISLRQTVFLAKSIPGRMMEFWFFLKGF